MAAPKSSFDYLYCGPSLNSLLARFLPDELRRPPLNKMDCNGFLTIDGLLDLVGLLRRVLIGPSLGKRALLDLGCGLGGLSRYIAEQLGCRVVGIDASAYAVARARNATKDQALTFRTADFATTHLDSESVSATFSIDALYMANAPQAALAEAHRVLKPGGILLFTTYASKDALDERRPEMWLSVAKGVGFAVESCRDLTAAWRTVMREKHQARWNHRDELFSILGKRAEAELAVSAAMLGIDRPSFLDKTERHQLVLQRST